MFFGWENVEKSQVILLLQSLKDLFSNKEVWIYLPEAIDNIGQQVDPTSTQAVKWNLLGACDKLTLSLYKEPLASFISCATREYLNSLSGDELIHGKLNCDNELALIILALEDLNENN